MRVCWLESSWRGDSGLWGGEGGKVNVGEVGGR
jgi:hypothetical protein